MTTAQPKGLDMTKSEIDALIARLRHQKPDGRLPSRDEDDAADALELLSASKPSVARDCLTHSDACLSAAGGTADDVCICGARAEQQKHLDALHASDAYLDALAASPAAPVHCQCAACKTGTIHASDCAVHNGPACSIGLCDCSAGAPAQSAQPVAIVLPVVGTGATDLQGNLGVTLIVQPSPTAVVLDDERNEREAFEHWMTHDYGYDAIDMQTHQDGVYILSAVHEAWEGWQGARAALPQPVAQPVEQARALTVTPAMVKAAMPWLTSLHHMRKTDKESYVEEAIKAAMTAARPASGETE